jgi:hypothetical protein
MDAQMVIHVAIEMLMLLVVAGLFVWAYLDDRRWDEERRRRDL